MNTTRLTIAGAGLCLTASVLAACGGTDPGADPTGPSTSSPSATPLGSPTESPSAAETPTQEPSEILDVGGLPTGAKPGLAYARLDYHGTVQRGGTIHALDGSTVPLPPYSLNEFVPFGNDWVVDLVDPDNGDEFVAFVSGEGEYSEPRPVSGGIAVSPGGNVVAWTGLDGTVYAAHAKTGDVLTLPKIPSKGPYRTVGVTSEDCKEGRTSDAGCSVIVNGGGGRPGVYVTTSHGIVDSVPRMLAATSSQGRRVGGMYSVDEDTASSCSRMRSNFTRMLWKTCDNILDSIAPDGRHLVGLPGYLDGFGPNALDILSMSDGRPVRSWSGSAAAATYFDQVWEDSTHLLIRTFQNHRWAIVRVGVDGSLEYALEPVKADSLKSPIVLQTR
jgi:hypothetical protein